LQRSNIKIFLNIRTDGFLLGLPDALNETLTRIKAYESTGVNGIFVPCIIQEGDISAVVKSTRLPVNVMCMPQLPGFETLKKLGVKRISMGPFVSNYANQKAEMAIKAIVQENNFSFLFK
jgi:2-methylisocitrate lyase-like PEP mutase family enzyme